MTKIGIFGDSFGAPSAPHTNHGDASIGMKYHWASLLANDINAELVIEAVTGGSLFFAYNKFLTNHTLYDVIIITVPDYRRYPIPIGENIHICSLDHVELLRKTIDSKHTQELDTATKWFESTPNSYLVNAADLMVEKIKQIRPDAIIIPTSTTSVGEQVINELGIPAGNLLVDLFFEQLAQLDVSQADINIKVVENPKLISGHLVPEMHEFFYSILKERYETGKWNYKKCTRLQFKHRADEYFIKI